MEQDLKLRLLYDGISNPETPREDIITVFMALQEQNFVLSNSLTNLVNKWPKKPPEVHLIIKGEASKSGTLSVTKD